MIEDSLYSTVFLFSVATVIFLTVSYINVNSQPLRQVHISRGIWTLATIVILYFGFRPISQLMGDTRTYAAYYKYITQNDILEYRDFGFYYLMMLFRTAGLSVTVFFTAIAFIYVGCIAKASKICLPQYALCIFLAYLATLSFYGFGINGIRNGAATSLFILGISMYYFRKRSIGILFILLSCTFHKSLLLLILLFLLFHFKRNLKTYYYAWGFCLILSLVSGRYFENLFTQIGLLGDEIDYLTIQADARSFAIVGYRYDFVLYGCGPVIYSLWILFKKKFSQDEFYNTVVALYLGANAFWLLMNQNWLSNRYAYLSWVFMPLIYVYPIARSNIRNKKIMLSVILTLIVSFSLIMWLLGKYR